MTSRRALGCSLWLAMGAGCTEAAVVAVDAAAPDVGAAVDAGPPTPPADVAAVDAPVPVDAGLPALDYRRDDLWLCRPGMANDRCLSADLTATELHPDGTRTTVTSTPATAPAYDCFYVYPTVDVTGPAGNHTDLTRVAPMLDPLLNQAARFREQCRVVAPLYRQATLLGLNGTAAAGHLAVAFRDVEAAFREYLRRDARGRPFVLMGHSQGSFMAERLLTSVILPDPALRARLIVALLVGGAVQVPVGSVANGTLGAFPLCTADDETGCAVAYDCTSNASLRSYLAVRPQPAAGDMRRDPIPYGSLLFAPSFLGLHWLDYNLALGDLQALVARKAARFASGT